MKKLFVWLFFIISLISCNNCIEKKLAEKIFLFENIDSTCFMGYKIFLMREDVKKPNFAVYRNDGANDYGVISTKPEMSIEKNFSNNLIDIFL